MSGSGISWAICKYVPRSRQITTPAPHHSVFYRPMSFMPPNQQRQSTEGKLFNVRQFQSGNFVSVIFSAPPPQKLGQWVSRSPGGLLALWQVNDLLRRRMRRCRRRMQTVSRTAMKMMAAELNTTTSVATSHRSATTTPSPPAAHSRPATSAFRGPSVRTVLPAEI